MKKLPKKVDLRKHLKNIPVYDQSELGSSVACALAVSFALEHAKKSNVNFIYYNSK
jgi:hypothetical protein